MGGRISPLNAKQLEQILSRYGFELVSQRGSHRKWRNPETGRQVIVPFHGGRELPIGTLRSILAGADIPETEWRG